MARLEDLRMTTPWLGSGSLTLGPSRERTLAWGTGRSSAFFKRSWAAAESSRRMSSRARPTQAAQTIAKAVVAKGGTSHHNTSTATSVSSASLKVQPTSALAMIPVTAAACPPIRRCRR